MTDYVVTYVSEAGQRPLTLAVSLGNDEQARQFASRTAQRVHGVTLETVDDDGATAAMARWLDGALTRNPNGNSARVIDTDETEDEVSDDEAIADEHDDDEHHFEGQCMKCRVKREFVGRVKELSNGSRQAQGSCPVCGTTIVRMVARTTPLDDDWSDEPSAEDVESGNADMPLTDPETGDALDENPDDDPDAGLDDEPVTEDENPDDNPDANLHTLNREKKGRTTTFTCSCGDWQEKTRNKAAETQAIAHFDEHKAEAEIAEAISDAAEGIAVAAVAEATTELAAEFSHAAEEVEKPRKRAAKKANADNRTPNQRAAANPTKGHCPKCDQDVDVIERAGIRIFTVHPDPAKGLDRCPGSTTVVSG